MTDLIPVLNELLKSRNAPPTANPTLSLQHIDEFLKEAYRIVSSGSPYFSSIPAYLASRIRILLHSIRTLEKSANPTYQPLRLPDVHILPPKTSNCGI